MVEIAKRGQEVLDSGEKRALPVIMYLHGAGESVMSNHELGRTSLSNYVSGPVIFVTPHRPAGNTWEPDAIRVLVERIISEYPADEKRLYITGFSMGARGVWDTVCEYPNIFAAALPLAGYSSYLRASRIAHLPVWAHHGYYDEIVPFEESKKMISALIQQGNNNAKLSAFKAQHYISDKVYSNIKVFQWLMEHTNERFDTNT